MSAIKQLPKGPLAIAIIFILLFVAEGITVAFMPGMPPLFWAIGGTFLILGILILVILYRKYQKGEYGEQPTSEASTTPPIAMDISDGKLFRGHLIIVIVLIILISVLFGLAFHPFAVRSTKITNIVVGVLLMFVAILNLIIYLVKPKKMRQRYLDGRAKKAAKKGN